MWTGQNELTFQITQRNRPIRRRNLWTDRGRTKRKAVTPGFFEKCKLGNQRPLDGTKNAPEGTRCPCWHQRGNGTKPDTRTLPTIAKVATRGRRWEPKAPTDGREETPGAKGQDCLHEHRQDAGGADRCQKKHVKGPKGADNGLSTITTPEARTGTKVPDNATGTARTPEALTDARRSM